MSLSALGDTSPLTFLPGGFDIVDFKLLNLQNKKAIPNLVTVEVNKYIRYMYANRILKKNGV
jgi:hypothetical protein